MTTPVVKVPDIAYVRLRVPDLDVMETYLSDFGMQTSARTASALYMRGTGSAHHVHVSEKGSEPGLVGVAFLAARAGDLDALAKVPGASAVHDIDEPGGGTRVTIDDPFGFRVELVHGIESLDPLPVTPSLGLNLGGRVERKGLLKRVGKGPARVLRIGHAGINVGDPDVAFDWYSAHFGLRKTDSMAVGDFALAHFCRCDRGSDCTDHHTLVFARAFDGQASFNHASFEVCDLDDVWIGHEHLASRGYRHTWGVARHTLGSQIFDYWRDPWGLIHEHYTDGDLLDASCPPEVHETDSSQWGPGMPADFGRPLSE
jgi:catechol 2,3-dioxygenase-like lactoylglutathione lyase family enzyme